MLLRKIFFLFLLVTSVHAQEMGFGCLGLVGGFVGYGIQQYQPGGINAYILDLNEVYKGSMVTELSKFHQMQGYRLGLNIYKKDFSGFIVSFKTSYQALSEKQEVTIQQGSSVPTINTYETRLKSYSVGTDVGMQITKSFQWKVVDAWVSYNTIQFSTQTNSVYGIIESNTYKTPEKQFGYSLGTGFIYYLIEKYVSLEGSVGITTLHANTLQDESGKSLQLISNNKEVTHAIQSGGLAASFQLNLSFPL